MNLLDRLVAIWRTEHPEEPRALPSPSGLSRRRFLQILGASTAVAAAAPLVDLEQLIWTPGQVVAVGEYGLVTPDWVTREALRILERNLEMVSMIDRQYGEGFAVGSVVQVCTPSQFLDRHAVVTDQICVEVDAGARNLPRPDYRARVLEPAMDVVTRRAQHDGISMVGTPPRPGGLCTCATATDGETGAGVRYVEAYDVWDGREVARFDVMGTRG